MTVGVEHSAKHVTKQNEVLRVPLRKARHQICTLKTEYNLKLLKDRDIQKRGATMKIVVIKVKNNVTSKFVVNTLKEPRPKRPTLRT